MIKKAIILAMVFICLAGLVDAVPPAFTSIDTTTGFEIKVPFFKTYQKSTSYNFEFHVFNKTTGIPVVEGIVCYFHLYGPDHEHLVKSNISTVTAPFDYITSVAASNFSDVGTYSYIVQCNSSDAGGFVSAEVEVTTDGTEATDAQSTLYLGLLILVFLLFATCLAFAISIDGENVTQIGSIIKVNLKKHAKTALYIISYIFFIFLTYLLWAISEKFLNSLGTGIFQIIFMMSWVMAFPIIAILLIKLILEIVTDKRLVALAKRGLKER